MAEVSLCSTLFGVPSTTLQAVSIPSVTLKPQEPATKEDPATNEEPVKTGAARRIEEKAAREAAKLGLEPPKTERPLEELQRTIIVKNVALKVKRQHLLAHLKLDTSQVESIRFRSQPLKPQFAKNKLVGVITKSYTVSQLKARTIIFSQSEDAPQSAYIVLNDQSEIERLLLSTGSELHKKIIFVDRAATSAKFSLFDRITTVFVGRLPKRFGEEDVFKLFSTVGQVTNVRVIRDPITKLSKGFGFVKFASKASVSAAITRFAKEKIDGHELRVTKPMKESEAEEAKLGRNHPKSKGNSRRPNPANEFGKHVSKKKWQQADQNPNSNGKQGSLAGQHRADSEARFGQSAHRSDTSRAHTSVRKAGDKQGAWSRHQSRIETGLFSKQQFGAKQRFGEGSSHKRVGQRSPSGGRPSAGRPSSKESRTKFGADRSKAVQKSGRKTQRGTRRPK